MAISAEQIDEWRQAPSETENLEFKEASRQYDTQNLFEYCVAIGNARGGHLILGVRNKIPRMVVGTQAIENPVGMSEKLFDKLGFRVHIDVVNHPDGRVVVLSIPSRPSGSAFHLDGRYLMRVGESVRSMSEDELRRILIEQPRDWLEEPAMERIGAAKILEVLDLHVLFERINAPFPNDFGSIVSRLLSERLIEDNGGGSYSIKRITAIALAKDLRTFDLGRKAPRVLVYKGPTRIEQPAEDKVGVLGYAKAFPMLVRFVNDNMPHREVIGGDGLNRSVGLVPTIMVRELLANALIHQDFSVTGTSVVIEIFDKRIEVSNPGQPIVPVERLISERRSRNERLAEFMKRMRVCEERGSGIDKVVDAAESLNLPAPDFRAPENGTLFTIYGPKPFEEMDRDSKVRACSQHCALKFEHHDRMTNQSLRERFKLPDSKSNMVTQTISDTIEMGLIKPDDKAGSSRKFARYVPHWA